MKARPRQLMPHRPDPAAACASLAARLGDRRDELEQAVLARVAAISDPDEASDPAYVDGLRLAIGAALDYGLAAIASTADRPAPVPDALLAQARLAARSGVGLDTIVRRYAAGQALLGDLLLAEAAEASLGAAQLRPASRSLSRHFESLLATVSEEYERELARRSGSSHRRRLERLQRLLEGETLDPSPLAAEFSYDFEGRHLGLVLAGAGAGEAARELMSRLDGTWLLLAPAEDRAWAWVTARHLPSAEELATAASSTDAAAVGCGEPAAGVAGFRLSHRQALAALLVAARGLAPFVRYGEAALLAAALRDDLLAGSLRCLYLEPLASGRDGERLLETLRAYLAAERNVSSAAVALGVKRHTVTNRLRVIEARLGHPLDARLAELELALRLEELEPPS